MKVLSCFGRDPVAVGVTLCLDFDLDQGQEFPYRLNIAADGDPGGIMKKRSTPMMSMALAVMGCLAGFVLFAASAEATEKIVDVDCHDLREDKTFETTLSPDVDSVGFRGSGCVCYRSAADAKSQVAADAAKYRASAGKIVVPQQWTWQPQPIKPGETVEAKLYCYSVETVQRWPGK